MPEKKLTRPRKGRMIAGICSGLANYFGVDPTLIRLIYAILTAFTAFVGIPIYIIMWIIIPEEQNRYLNND